MSYRVQNWHQQWKTTWHINTNAKQWATCHLNTSKSGPQTSQLSTAEKQHFQKQPFSHKINESYDGKTYKVLCKCFTFYFQSFSPLSFMSQMPLDEPIPLHPHRTHCQREPALEVFLWSYSALMCDLKPSQFPFFLPNSYITHLTHTYKQSYHNSASYWHPSKTLSKHLTQMLLP